MSYDASLGRSKGRDNSLAHAKSYTELCNGHNTRMGVSTRIAFALILGCIALAGCNTTHGDTYENDKLLISPPDPKFQPSEEDLQRYAPEFSKNSSQQINLVAGAH